MSGLFSNPNVLDAFDKSFNGSDEGIVSSTGETTLAQEGFDFNNANDKARAIANKGSKPEDLELELDDPRYDSMQAQYERQMETYRQENKMGEFAADPAEIERLRQAGHSEEELQTMSGRQQAPDDILQKAREMSKDKDGPNANEFLNQQGFRSLEPEAPTKRKTRRQLREELGISSRDIDNPRRLSDLDFELVQDQMIKDTLGAQAPRKVIEESKKYQSPTAYVRSQGYGTRNMLLGRMADPTYRKSMGLDAYPVDVPRDRGVLEKSFNSLDKGVTRLNSLAVAGRYMAAQYFSMGGLMKTPLSEALMNSAVTIARHQEIALLGKNVDPITGQNFGDLKADTLAAQGYYAALESLPEFVVTVASAFVGGGSVSAAKIAAKKMASESVAQATARIGVEALRKRAITTGARRDLMKQATKARARQFTAMSSAQVYANTLSDGINYYVSDQKMDPFAAAPLVMGEAFMAAMSTAITQKVSSDFLFMTPAGTYAARSGTMNFLNNLMVGATSEGLQEMSEQVLTDAALASIAAIRGDADKMARVGFLREGYLNDLAVAGLAGAFLGGPTGTVTRAGAQAEQRANPTESSQWSAEEKAVYLEQKSQRQKQASQDEYNRQTAVAESRTEDLEKVSNEDLMYAMLNPIVDDDASLIHAGRDGGRFRVTPLIASLELQRRGMSATEPQQAFLSDYLEGAKSIEEMTEADLDAASRGDRDVYYEARDGRRRRLTQGAAQRESKRRKKPTEGRPDPLTQEQRQEYEAELLTGEPSEEAMLALIMAAPEVAQEAAQNGLSRSLFNRLMGEMTGDPRDRGTNKAVRKKLQNLLSNNLDFIRTEVGSRSRTTVGLSVAPTFADTDAQQDRSPPPSQTIGTPDGNIEVEDDGASGFVGDGPQEISTPDGVQSVEFEESTEFIRRRREGRAGRSPVTTSRDPGGRFAPTTMSESETRAQDRRRSQEEVGPQTRSLTEADRTKVDSALDSVLEETGDDLLRDTSLSNRQVARRLPRSIPFGKRLQRVRELRMRRGITNAVTDSRASTTEQQSDLDQAQDARNKQEAQERGVLAGESPGDMATAAQGGLEVQSFMDEYFEGSARLLSDQRNQEIINEQSQSDDEMAASMHVDEDNSPELSEEQQQESEAIAEENNSNTEQLAERSSADMTTRSNAEENENVDDEDDLEDEGDILVEPLSKNNKLKGLGARLLAPLHFVAQKAGVNSRPYKVMQKLIHLEIQQLFANRRDMSEAKEAFNALPEDWKNKEDNKLSQAMDQYIPMQEGEQEVQFEAEVVDAQGQARTEPVTARTESEARAKLEEMGLSLRSEGMRQTTAQPELTLEPDAELTINGETMKVSDLPPEVQSSLAYFKRKSEEHRLEAIEDKRDLARSMFNGMTNKDLVKAAREGENAAIPGLEKSRVDGSDLFSADGRVYSKEEVVEKLVMNRVPDDWGYKYAHFHHAWFGKYKLRAYDKDGNALNVPGEANTEGEAYELLRQFKSSAAGAAAVRFEAKPAYDEDADFLNMTRRERNALKRALKSETNATSEQINDALFKGRVTLAENKKPFFKAMMERGGAEGYSMDFAKVWTTYTRARNRYKYGRMMIKAGQVEIEALKKQGDPLGKYIEESLNRGLFVRQTGLEVTLDNMIQSIPFFKSSPMPSRRFFASVRSFNYLRQLKTPKQWAVNSTQPLQTIYPIVGEKGFLEAVAFYNSAEGKALLAKYGSMDQTSGMYIDGTDNSLGQKAIEAVTKTQAAIDKHGLRGLISTQSEVRNMNFSFVAMYLHGKRQGLSEAEAVEYGRVQGYIGSQFMFSRLNLPPILDGPIASTLLQYRRFQLNMIGFALTLRKGEGGAARAAGLGRWLAVNATVGGAKGFMFTVLPFYTAGSAIGSALGWWDDKDAKVRLAEFRRAAAKVVGKTNADALVFGLPAYAGVDLSGSTGLFTDMYGESLADQAFNQFSGPSVSFVIEMASIFDEMGEAGNTPLTTEAYMKFKDTSPTFKWLAKNVEVLAGFEDDYDEKGRLRFRDEDKGRGMWMELAGGMRTVPQAVMNLEYSNLMFLKDQETKYMDRAATQLVDGDYKGAIETINLFNGLYPDMAFRVKDLTRRMSTKYEDRTTNGLERYLKNSSKRARTAFSRQQKDSE